MLEASTKVKFLSGEHRRERVITPKEEVLYLAATLPLLHDVPSSSSILVCARKNATA